MSQLIKNLYRKESKTLEVWFLVRLFSLCYDIKIIRHVQYRYNIYELLQQKAWLTKDWCCKNIEHV
jgi:hypothetical protein